MPGCAVYGCKNYSRTTKGSDVKYYRFPTDSTLLGFWLTACGRQDRVNLKDARICSVHFAPECFIMSLKQQLPDFANKNWRNLKADAVPTLHVPEIVKRTLDNLTELPCKKKQKTEITVDTESRNTSTELVNMRTELQTPLTNTLRNEYSQTDNDSSDKTQQCSLLEEEIEELKTENANLKKALLEKDAVLKCILNNLEKFLTLGQIKRLRESTHKNMHWTPDDIAAAMSLRNVSPKAYRYLKSVEFPLPALSTLRNWAANLSVQPGILFDVLRLLACKAKNMQEIEKLCVLSFDEMYVSNRIDIEKRNQQKIGPHSTCQTVMARGIVGHWKQPVFYDFGKAMDISTMKDIVRELYKVGFTVVAIVSDMGPKNMKLWREGNIGYDKNCYIQHPTDSTLKIFVMADIPHLIKLLRNHLLDHNLVVNGTMINKSCLETLLDISTSELSIAFKLNRYHLDVKGSERQKVKPAVQLFSRTTAKALEFCGKHGMIPPNIDWKEVSTFVLQINNWFDVHNSRTKFAGDNPMRNAFGVNLEDQIKILEETTNLIKNMTVGNHKNLILFQKGIMLSNKSVMELFYYVKEKYGVQYILTARLNQDVLENFFAYIRGMGATNEHPHSLDFMYRLRWYLLGRNSAACFTNNKNTEETNEECLLLQLETRDEPCITNNMLGNLSLNLEISPSDNEIVDNQFIEPEYAEISVGEDSPFELAGVLQDFEFKEKVNEQALKYIAGYVAHKYKSKYNLGNSTMTLDKNTNVLDWLGLVSRGGLLHPNEELFTAAKIMEHEFYLMHGASLTSEKYMFKTLTEKTLSKLENTSLPYEVVFSLCKTRTYIRLKHINQKISFENCKRKLGRKLSKFTCRK